jgi:putative multicomponent Na+:H+ antiporter subunit B
MNNLYIYCIVALLPLTALMVIFQKNPYQAIVMRGILGAIAALVYAILGAPDVALTEALVGTLLAITLYAIAVRSSMLLRLGVVEGADLGQCLEDFRSIANKHHLQLELVAYEDSVTLEKALLDREIHASCVVSIEETYHTAIRVEDFYEIFEKEMASPARSVIYTGGQV